MARSRLGETTVQKIMKSLLERFGEPIFEFKSNKRPDVLREDTTCQACGGMMVMDETTCSQCGMMGRMEEAKLSIAAAPPKANTSLARGGKPVQHCKECDSEMIPDHRSSMTGWKCLSCGGTASVEHISGDHSHCRHQASVYETTRHLRGRERVGGPGSEWDEGPDDRSRKPTTCRFCGSTSVKFQDHVMKCSDCKKQWSPPQNEIDESEAGGRHPGHADSCTCPDCQPNQRMGERARTRLSPQEVMTTWEDLQVSSHQNRRTTDPKGGLPGEVSFEELVSWLGAPEGAVKAAMVSAGLIIDKRGNVVERGISTTGEFKAVR